MGCYVKCSQTSFYSNGCAMRRSTPNIFCGSFANAINTCKLIRKVKDKADSLIHETAYDSARRDGDMAALV